ncbi:aspartate carbamoyltransferase catalytic subunit [Amphibacillus cookii]|uniref:aspartate carbamoyltransferase catalytic subunit n=1 Tax=Amphibacillus cookii TaxID=767787 RepID=UPI00195CA43A|nr:aspartate carbamoyltransferase catalytic subunit [Amphibacillus cookii]MBM7540507.1 aspartate carbamoyltransferase catalytic subunit [Amphibacillus cookii]
MNNFVSMKTIKANEIIKLLEQTDAFANGQSFDLSSRKKRFIANLFYEPSTRTKMSFEVAEKKLGLEVLDFHAERSSVLKGESVYDTAKTFASIGAEALVIRHPINNQVQQLAEALDLPVINAGDGAGEHPTQSLLDLYTMYQEFGAIKGLNVLIVGDILHSRVARSNAYALKALGANVYLAAKPEWKDQSLDFPYVDLDQAIEQCDVVMLLRIQLERHQQSKDIKASAYLTQYGLTVKREQRMKKEAIIMHPAPINRGVEIDDKLVECQRSRIFKQMENGVYARMAVIHQLLNKGESRHGNDYQTMFAYAH